MIVSTSHSQQRTAPSVPADLIDWQTNPAHTIPRIESLPYRSSLNPIAPIFEPKSKALSTQPQPKPDLNKKAYKAPCKQVKITLPGQKLLTSFMTPRHQVASHNQDLSLSLSVSLPQTSQIQTHQGTHALSTDKPQPSKTIKSVQEQRTIFDFAYFKPQSSSTDSDPDVWGHLPESIDTTKTFRILLQNPNGIKPSVTEPEFVFSLHICHEIGVGAICIAETNINWHHSQHTYAFQRCLHKNWKSSKFQTSIQEEHFIGNYQPGGTATVITDQWTSRVISSGQDPYGLGRWSYII
jgi:hypothetical protein